ncbi:glutathione-dependent formaldehyde-activating GFA [Xylariaceae sp. FL1272]|nr:glutathione-dependent formaldehyde-activating GFA [Xylariaceae sp. FL1272]
MSEPSIHDFPKPTFVTGGCLCGSIRYRVEFPKDHDFLQSCGSCQCTQCRRNTGSLFFTAHSIRQDSMTYTTSLDTLKNFSATPGIHRGICTNCGSFLYWRDTSTETIEIAVGCIDPEFLFAEDGKGEAFGFALANMAGSNFYCRNQIQGVTDKMIGNDHGIRWAKGSAEGIRM